MQKRKEALFGFGKKKTLPPQQPASPKINVNVSELKTYVYEKYFKKFLKKSLPISVGPCNSSDDDLSKRLSCKIGGNPYWLATDAWPTFGDKPMLLVAQINFAELPAIEGFPTSGILQFFAVEDIWEYEGDTKCIYHAMVNNDQSKWLKEIPRATFNDSSWDVWKGMFFFSGSTFENQLPSWYDDLAFTAEDEKLIQSDILEYINSRSGQRFEKYDALPQEYKVISSILYDDTPRYGSRMSGYPDWTQFDPREDEDVLLLQIDSGEDILWGDMGIANFTISSDNLRKRDFSKVLMSWDCL